MNDEFRAKFGSEIKEITVHACAILGVDPKKEAHLVEIDVEKHLLIFLAMGRREDEFNYNSYIEKKKKTEEKGIFNRIMRAKPWRSS